MKRQPGRPPLDAKSATPSADVHLKLSTEDYDRAYAMATAEGISLPELVRNSIAVSDLLDRDCDLTAWQAFRIVRARRISEKEAIDNDRLASMAARHARRSGRLRAGFIERVRRDVVYKKHGGICGICLLPVDRDSFHVDHVIPLASGGKHSYENTQPAHPICNFKKGGRP